MLCIIKDVIIIGISIYLGILIERIRRDIRELRDFDNEDDDRDV